MYEIFISLRYLRSRLISLIATIVLALGVAVLLIVTSVMGGFQREFHSRLRGLVADVAIESARPFGIFDGPDLVREVEKHPQVAATAPYVHHFMGVKTKLEHDYGFLKGVVPEREKEIGKFAENLLSPYETLEAELEIYRPEDRRLLRERLKEFFDSAPRTKPDPVAVFASPPGEPPALVVGVNFYIHARMRMGDEVTLVSISPDDALGGKLSEKSAREMVFRVAGVFKSGMYEQDRRLAYTTLEAAQEFLDIARKEPENGGIATPARISGVNVKLRDYMRAEEVASQLDAALKWSGLLVKPWNKHNENLIKAVATEQFMIGFIVFFMIVLASVCLAAILTLGVIEKTKDLGILGSVGATRGGIMRIFLYQGGVIAALGAALGTGFGLLFLWKINWIDEHVVGAIFGRRAFDSSIYYLDHIPTEISWPLVAWCVGATVLLGFLMALYPGYRAATLDPIEALRYE